MTIDQALLWDINPVTGRTTSGQSGLAGLRPGTELQRAYQPAPLDPSSQFPTPQFSPQASSYFKFAQDQIPHMFGTAPMRLMEAPTPGAANPGTTPYFDPNYPMESEVALRDSLAPQVREGALAGLRARGLYSTGVGKYAVQDSLNYLGRLAPPGMNQQGAMAQDFNRLYGPAVTNSLEKSGDIGAGLPGDYSFGEGGGLPGFTGLVGNADKNGPQYGVINYNPGSLGGTAYASPGYFYDPNHAPDVSKMPWLGGAGTPGRSYSPNV